MGVWGAGIFQDDNACDIRDDYKDYLGQGMTGPEATVRILADFKSLLADPHGDGVVWLALSLTQWKLGRLEPEVLSHALGVIDSGSNLKHWEVDAKDRRKRQAVLEKLRAQISSPQPPESKVAHRRKSECDWLVGELVAWRLASGRQIILRVIGHKIDKGGKYPYCELLDWIGSDLPSEDFLRKLGKRSGMAPFGGVVKEMMIVGMNRKWAPRAERLNIQSNPSEKSKASQVIQWKELDRVSKEWFQLE